jgi:hypothetical protein
MGISKIVFTVYRNSIALALLAPFAYMLEKWAHAYYFIVSLSFIKSS